MSNWAEFEGVVLLEGIDPTTLAPTQITNLAYAMLLRNRDEKSRAKFLNDLEMPPEGVEATEGVWSDDEMGAAFEQAAASLP